MYYVAFDVDGVLLDVSERLRVAEELSKHRGNFWDIFFDEELLHLDKPREAVRDLIRSRAARYGLIVITGRPRRLYHITLNQLMTYYDVRPVRTYMRGNFSRKPPNILKLELIEEALSDGFQIVEYHDDDEEVLRSIKNVYPNIRLYLHEGDSYRVYWEGTSSET